MYPDDIKKDCKRYSTGLPAGKGKVILESIQGQLSDGYWENSRPMEGYWKFFCVDASGDEAVICVANKSVSWQYGGGRLISNRFWGFSHRKMLEWFARRIYEIAKYEKDTWPEREFRPEKGNKGVSLCLGGSGNELTGDDVWSLRKALLDLAKAM